MVGAGTDTHALPDGVPRSERSLPFRVKLRRDGLLPFDIRSRLHSRKSWRLPIRHELRRGRLLRHGWPHRLRARQSRHVSIGNDLRRCWLLPGAMTVEEPNGPNASAVSAG